MAVICRLQQCWDLPGCGLEKFLLKKASVLDPGLMKINQSMQSKALMNIAYGRNKECSSTGSLNSYLSPIVSNDLKCLNDSSELLGTTLLPPASDTLASPLQNNQKIELCKNNYFFEKINTDFSWKIHWWNGENMVRGKLKGKYRLDPRVLKYFRLVSLVKISHKAVFKSPCFHQYPKSF